MMKKAAFIVMVLLLAAPVSYATDKKDSWLNDLKSKIEKLVPKKTSSTTNVVGGVRGAKGASDQALYWKGKEDKAVIGDAELVAFKTALEAAINGNTPGAIKEFEAFIAMYPESPLSNEAEKTVKLLKEQ